MTLEHQINQVQVVGTDYEDNEPFDVPDRGILFIGDRYLRTELPDGLYWMLDHPHFFTIEAWVRKKWNDVYLDSIAEEEHGNIPGIIFNKVDTNGTILFGMDMDDDTLRYHLMGTFYDISHGIATNDEKWHFVSGFYMRYDFDALTDLYPFVDDGAPAFNKY